MKRLTLIVALPIVAMMLGLLVISLFGNKVTRENLDRIQIGMTQDQVRALIGPPDDKPPNGRFFTPSVAPKKHQMLLTVKWNSRNAIIEVWFDFDDRVVFKRFWTGGDSFLDSIWRRLGLPKEEARFPHPQKTERTPAILISVPRSRYPHTAMRFAVHSVEIAA